MDIGRLLWRADQSQMFDEIRISRDPSKVEMRGRFTGMWAEIASEEDFVRFRDAEQREAERFIAKARELKRELAGRLRWKAS